MDERSNPTLRRELGNVQTQRIVLIDGERLAGLMSEHGVGVRTERTIAIKKVDLDYFEPEAD